MDNLSVLDYIFIFFILLMLIHGYVKGLVRELFSWASLILAIWVAVLLYPAGGDYIRTHTMENVRVVPELLAFIAIFLIIVFAVKILERILANIIEGARLGGVNRVLGAVFGLIEGVAFTALIIFILSVQPLFDSSTMIEGSYFAQFLLPIVRIPLETRQVNIETVLLILQRFNV